MSDSLERNLKAIDNSSTCNIENTPDTGGITGFCWEHNVDVHGGECAYISDMKRMMRIGFAAGRKDAIEAAAEAMKVRCEPFGAPVYVCKGTGFCDCFEPDPTDALLSEGGDHD